MHTKFVIFNIILLMTISSFASRDQSIKISMKTSIGVKTISDMVLKGSKYSKLQIIKSANVVGRKFFKDSLEEEIAQHKKRCLPKSEKKILCNKDLKQMQEEMGSNLKLWPPNKKLKVESYLHLFIALQVIERSFFENMDSQKKELDRCKTRSCQSENNNLEKKAKLLVVARYYFSPKKISVHEKKWMKNEIKSIATSFN